MSFSIIPFLEGMSLTFSLIIAIGIQNAFVLKQGILRNHTILIAFLCSFIDSIMITIGVYGFGAFLSNHETLLRLFSWGGIIFVFGYSILAFRASFKNSQLNLSQQTKIDDLKQIFIKVFLISVVNPNAFLDSIILMGSVSAQFPKEEHLSFTIGAAMASYIWFFSLSLAAKFLQPFFTKPKAWKILDFIIGCTMFAIGISLLNKLNLGI